MSCAVGCRRDSDSKLLWLWRRPVATAPIRPLAFEIPYAVGVAQKMANRKKKKKKKKRDQYLLLYQAHAVSLEYVLTETLEKCKS